MALFFFFSPAAGIFPRLSNLRYLHRILSWRVSFALLPGVAACTRRCVSCSGSYGPFACHLSALFPSIPRRCLFANRLLLLTDCLKALPGIRSVRYILRALSILPLEDFRIRLLRIYSDLKLLSS